MFKVERGLPFYGMERAIGSWGTMFSLYGLKLFNHFCHLLFSSCSFTGPYHFFTFFSTFRRV